jgi:hypothetical protein
MTLETHNAADDAELRRAMDDWAQALRTQDSDQQVLSRGRPLGPRIADRSDIASKTIRLDRALRGMSIPGLPVRLSRETRGLGHD